jgi:hypothetical protein
MREQSEQKKVHASIFITGHLDRQQANNSHADYKGEVQLCLPPPPTRDTFLKPA